LADSLARRRLPADQEGWVGQEGEESPLETARQGVTL